MGKFDAVFEDAKDTAQAAVTALMLGDRDTAGDILEEFPPHLQIALALALVLADLCVAIHKTWCTNFVGEDKHLVTWQSLMLDVEEWRTRDK